MSVAEQTYNDLEIICIDDGSKDKTREKLTQLKERFPEKVKLIFSENRGAPAARNLGLANAKGQYIQFLDADDVLVKEKLELQVSAFDKETDMVVSDREVRNEDLTRVLETYSFPEIINNPLETTITSVISTCNPIYSRGLLDKVGGYDENLKAAQDWELHLRIVLAGAKMNYLPGVFCIIRQVGNSLSSNWIKVSIQAADVIIKNKEAIRSAPGLNDKTRSRLSMICYLSAVHTTDKKKSETYAEAASFWIPDNSFIQNPVKRFIAKVFGLKGLVKLEKLKKG